MKPQKSHTCISLVVPLAVGESGPGQRRSSALICVTVVVRDER